MKLEHYVSVYVLKLVEDPNEDLINYAGDADDDKDKESSKDDGDEEEEHLDPTESTAISSPALDPVPSSEEKEPFDTDESTTTPPPPPAYRTTSRMSVRSQAHIPFLSEAELRAASPLPSPTSPPTHHPLPLPAPSTSRRMNILEGDIPPQKRLLLTTPTLRFEIRKSFAAAARQSRSTVAYAKRDHAALRDEVDPLRRYLSYLCTNHEHERVKAHQSLDRSEAYNRALETRIAVLETQVYRHEWQQRDADRSMNGDDSHDSVCYERRRMSVARECTYIDFLKCQPLNLKRTEGVVRLTQWFERMESVFHISNCVVKNLVKYATCTLHGNALTWWSSHVKTISHDAAYGMPWKTLMKMITDKYYPKGEIKKLKIKILNLKVKGTDVESYTQRFQELALLCGRMFPDVSDKVEKYVGVLPDMIQGIVMASKPKKMQDAIEFATELMDQNIHTLAECQAENRRKFKDTSRNNQNQQQPFKRYNVA
nr:hypothetical protein [Tanacetum cinerariifolium]